MMMTEIDSIGAFGLRVVCVYLCVRTSVCLAPVVQLLPWDIRHSATLRFVIGLSMALSISWQAWLGAKTS